MSPRYITIKKIYLDELAGNKYQIGGRFASEQNIMDRFGISRITARRVISELATEGYLKKLQGKGTFVIRLQPVQPIELIRSYTEEIQALGKQPGREVISRSIVKAESLKLSDISVAPDEDFYALERVYYADSTPFCHTTAYIRNRLFPGLEDYDFSVHSLYRVLEQEYKAIITRSELLFESVNSGEITADLLRIPRGSAVMRFSSLTYCVDSFDEKLFEYFVTYYPPEHTIYSIRQHRKNNA